MISQRTLFPWLHHRQCENLLHLLRQTRGSPSSGLFLLSGLQSLWEFCLMEFWDGNRLWQQDGSGEILIITFAFFLSPNSMTHGNSHFLLPPSTWLHYQQTAGDWICFWGWVTTLFLCLIQPDAGVRGGQVNAEGLETSLLQRWW